MNARTSRFEPSVKVKEAAAKILMVRSSVNVLKDLRCILRIMFAKVMWLGKENRIGLYPRRESLGSKLRESCVLTSGVLYIPLRRGVPQGH